MKRNVIKSGVLALTFTLALFAGANQTLATTKEHSGNAVKKIKVEKPVEVKLKGVDNARDHGGNAYSYGTAEIKLTGTKNAKAHGGKADAEEDDEVVVVEPAVKEAPPVLKGIENAKAHGGKANAYGTASDKLTGIENARAHGGNAYASTDADEDEVVVEAPAAIIAETVVAKAVSFDIDTPVLKGIENAKNHGGNAYAYGHCKKIGTIDLVQ